MSVTLERTAEYMVRNYAKSPVAVSTRDSSYLIPGGTPEHPAEFPLTLNEIIYINSASDVFRTGVLFFEEAYEAEIYDALRIRDWKSILRAGEIDDILLNPSTEKLERVIAIQSMMYFERIYGAYIGLKNAGYPISSGVDRVMTLRRRELSKGVARSEIKVKVVEPSAERMSAQDHQIAELQKRVAELTALLASRQDENREPPAVEKTAAAVRGRKRKIEAANASTEE